MADTYIPGAALVLVGDGRKALFLRNQGSPMHVNLVVERVFQQVNPPTREQGTDAPGRYAGTDGTAHSAFEETDWHQLAEDRFAHELAATLYRLAHAGAFQDLIIVAPPKVLGNLRATFHQEVTRRIVAEVAKDLTGHPVRDIGRLLAGRQPAAET